MTHTTTDAAEARTRELRAMIAKHKGWGEDWVPVRISTVEPLLATAEAASGAGEREKCGASPDHADILETIANAADDWQKQGYVTALAEVRDMANVGRALMEALPDGYHYMNCPSEIVTDIQNERDEALASLPPATDPAMVTVPREPTEAMIRAVEAVNFQTDDEHAMGCNVWQAMVAAAPTIPATGEAVQRLRDVATCQGPVVTIATSDLRVALGLPATGHAATEPRWSMRHVATVFFTKLKQSQKDEAAKAMGMALDYSLSSLDRGKAFLRAVEDHGKRGELQTLLSTMLAGDASGHAATEGEGA